jgi:hypothetical protein
LSAMSGSAIAYRRDGRLSAGAATIMAYVASNPRVIARCVVIDLAGRPGIVVDHDADPTNGCN